MKFCGKCQICNSNNLVPINSFCIFTNQPIYRFKCCDCGFIFGPINYIEMDKSELINKYKELYSNYQECDSTEREVKTFLSLNPKIDGKYLNFGSGIWSKSTKIIKEMGFDLTCYDFSFDVGTIDGLKFDGIISNNVIEHLQYPIESFKFLKSLLKDNGIMFHSSPCFKYKYEFSIFHLNFLIGKSVEILADKAGLNIEHFFDNGSDFIIKKFY